MVELMKAPTPMKNLEIGLTQLLSKILAFVENIGELSFIICSFEMSQIFISLIKKYTL